LFKEKIRDVHSIMLEQAKRDLKNAQHVRKGTEAEQDAVRAAFCVRAACCVR
jgi:hypothetical protein